MRDETEWIELVNCKSNFLAGANKEKILIVFRENLSFNKENSNKENSKLDLYGSGKASAKIVKELIEFCKCE